MSCQNHACRCRESDLKHYVGTQWQKHSQQSVGTRHKAFASYHKGISSNDKRDQGEANHENRIAGTWYHESLSNSNLVSLCLTSCSSFLFHTTSCSNSLFCVNDTPNDHCSFHLHQQPASTPSLPFFSNSCVAPPLLVAMSHPTLPFPTCVSSPSCNDCMPPPASLIVASSFHHTHVPHKTQQL